MAKTYKSQNLLTTLLLPGEDPFENTTTGCPSRTCCAPPSAFGAVACFLSRMLHVETQLTRDDLQRLLEDLKNRLAAQTRGADLQLAATSQAQYNSWDELLTGSPETQAFGRGT